ncbi:uncharacterized protein LOC130721538 [Lotus japonicus]|uniref:uncharacterized protein LOC130721538 n=1 Tax=Lotus japonicus TaxID=34305 RepID=UPI00258646ED|nr:uncharacterized protein LOC130721538 [Lotus japonicus]
MISDHKFTTHPPTILTAAKYCPLLPPPRSTISAAFSPDGKVLASTHGDHTVKLIDCQTGNCLQVVVVHRRTPWVLNSFSSTKNFLLLFLDYCMDA